MLHCPDLNCQTPNPEDQKFCQRCGIPLMRRFLWAVGESTAAYKPGDLLGDRYLCEGPRIFLDTKPSAPPNNFDEVPEAYIPYLKLSPYQLHIPQVYDWISTESTRNGVVLFLEQAPFYSPKHLKERGIVISQAESIAATAVQVLPRLNEVWQAATPIRQLNWLWQIAKLWQPMNQEGVASSLLQPELLCVEGSLLRLLELNLVENSLPLSVLGEFWSQLVQSAKPTIQAPLQQICQQLVQEELRNAEELLGALDQSITAVQGRAQQTQIEIATLTDQGPSRQRNEDACYPQSGTVINAPPSAPLVIVCDGIGGHQGGDVASNLAIQAIEQQVQALQPERLDPITLSVELEKAVCVANDRISQQNDSEQRFDRQRMGTTVVMGLVRNHELYVTHVGDSRVYWITRWGCHQITQDDDVASREVRLGYSTYPQALQQPSSGSLVQALGMGNSNNLYPTVQRFILDEDSIVLFCSDGLSDNDQVDHYWETVILPLLQGQSNLATVAQQLVEIANTQNGYDNATVGLVHYKIAATKANGDGTTNTALPPPKLTSPLDLAPTQPPRRSDTAIFAPTAQPTAQPSAPSTSTIKTQEITTRVLPQPEPAKFRLLPLLLGIIGLAGIAGVIAAFFWQQPVPNGQNPGTETPAVDQGSPRQIPKATTGSPSPGTVSLVQGSVVRANSSLVVQTVSPTDAGASIAPEQQAQIQSGDLIYILAQEPDIDGWVRFTVCPSVADGLEPSNLPPPSAPSVDSGQPDPGQSNLNQPAPQQPTNSPPPEAPASNLPGDSGEVQQSHSSALFVSLIATDKLAYSKLEPGKIAWVQEAVLAKTVTQFTSQEAGGDSGYECVLPENF